MEEKEWKRYKLPALTKDGPTQTGDLIVDSWEKKLRDGTLNLKDLE